MPKMNDHTNKVFTTKEGITIGPYSFEEYVDRVKSFHGAVAPGVVIGGFMVDLALHNLPDGEFFDALCETRACLPDAVQLLTPCTIGNGWLRILNLGRYALTLYEKYGGRGVRVFVDPGKLGLWPELEAWFFKRKIKEEQDVELLMTEIREAGAGYCGIQRVQLTPGFINRERRGNFSICPLCMESYPVADGGICRACQGDGAYYVTDSGGDREEAKAPALRKVPLEEAIGLTVLHDMTRIVPGQEKGPAFKRDQRISAGDLCRLQQMGRKNIYALEEVPEESEWVHEDKAALAFATAMAGEGVAFTEAPSEGKADLLAARDGLLVIDEKGLEAFNTVQGVMCASRHNYSVVNRDSKVGGTRAIPLYLSRQAFERALRVLAPGPLFRVLALRRARVGILVTGSEVFQGLIQDGFIPIVRHKVERFECQVVETIIVPDEKEAIAQGVARILKAGADLIVTTAGLSVDPDDVTKQGLIDAGVTDMLFGMPILPGAMTLIARLGDVQVIGVPACALFHSITSFDILLPRLLAGLSITRSDLARLGNGGLCLGCKACTFPKCPFGK